MVIIQLVKDSSEQMETLEKIISLEGVISSQSVSIKELEEKVAELVSWDIVCPVLVNLI